MIILRFACGFFLFFLAGPVLAIFLFGCKGPLPTTIDAIDTGWKTIKPRYIEYLNLDKSLDPGSKMTRIRTAEMLSRLIQEAKESYE